MLMIDTTESPFGLLYDIVIHGSQPNILFVFVVMDTIRYDHILGSYEVVVLNKYHCVYPSYMQCYHPFIHHVY